MTLIPAHTLVVVADGTGARLFRNRGDEREVALHQVELRELVNVDDDGPAGSMPGESTGQQIDEATFAKQLAHALNDGAVKQQYEQLVLIADPTTLGRMRPLLHKQVQARIIAEIPKTLTNAPVQDIERALRAPL